MVQENLFAMTILTFLAMYRIPTALFLAAALLISSATFAQNSRQFTQQEVYEKMTQKRNPYNLPIIDNVESYNALVREKRENRLVDLEKYIPGIRLDIRYATPNNFTGTQVYTMPKAYLVKEAAKALRKAQRELRKEGLGFVIYDAYRPYAATFYFREVYHDTTFVASPTTGSIHNRGCAVDLALVHIKTGENLVMPTEFDNFTEKASADYPDITAEQLANREKLRGVMEKHGFIINSDEWWHYNLKDNKRFPLLDISFEELQNL